MWELHVIMYAGKSPSRQHQRMSGGCNGEGIEHAIIHQPIIWTDLMGNFLLNIWSQDNVKVHTHTQLTWGCVCVCVYTYIYPHTELFIHKIWSVIALLKWATIFTEYWIWRQPLHSYAKTNSRPLFGPSGIYSIPVKTSSSASNSIWRTSEMETL